MTARDWTAVLIVLVAFSAVLPFALTDCGAAASDPDDDPPVEDPEPVTEVITAYGYVTNLSDQEENTPLSGVLVTLYDSDRQAVQVTEGANPIHTDQDGRFQFTFTHTEGDSYYLSFDYPGYTVRSLPDIDMVMEDGYVRFSPTAQMVDPEGDYALTGTADGPHAIVMVITTSTIYGTVEGIDDGEPFILGGATVTVVSESGVSYSTTTNSNGYFAIECPYGTYTLEASCNGFRSSGTLAVESGAGGAVVITLQQNTSEVLFGLDTAHAVMVLALLALVLMMTILGLGYRRSRDKGRESVFLNDLDSLDTKDDELSPGSGKH